jgi:hypothetical protein
MGRGSQRLTLRSTGRAGTRLGVDENWRGAPGSLAR